jgi:hypothetical protein
MLGITPEPRRDSPDRAAGHPVVARIAQGIPIPERGPHDTPPPLEEKKRKTAPAKQLRRARSRASDSLVMARPGPGRDRKGVRGAAGNGRQQESPAAIFHFDYETMTSFGDHEHGGSSSASAGIPAAGIL